MDLEIIILSDIRERQILHDITDMSNIKSNKNEKIMPFVVTWMNLQILTLSEVSQKIKTNII